MQVRLVAPGKPADAPCLAELSVTLTVLSSRPQVQVRLVAPGKPADAPCLAELSVTLTGMSVRRETLERLTPLLRPTGSVRSNHDRGGEDATRQDWILDN